METILYLVGISTVLILGWKLFVWYHSRQERKDREEANRNKDFWNQDTRNFN